MLDNSGVVLDALALGVVPAAAEVADAVLDGAELGEEELLQPALAAAHKSAARPTSAGRNRRMLVLSNLIHRECFP
jgi:hypothetical protein